MSETANYETKSCIEAVPYYSRYYGWGGVAITTVAHEGQFTPADARELGAKIIAAADEAQRLEDEHAKQREWDRQHPILELTTATNNHGGHYDR